MINTNKIPSDDEYYDYDDYEYIEEDADDHEKEIFFDDTSVPNQKIFAPRSFQPSSMLLAEKSTENSLLKNSKKSKRDDRVTFRHKTGDGIRRGHLTIGNDIDEAIAIYENGGEAYNDNVCDLRESTAEDLIPENERTINDDLGGVGSKVIQIIKVKKGTIAKHQHKHTKISKDEIVHQKIDMDPKHYWDHISHQLLEDGNFIQGKYDTFKQLALHERETKGIGNSPEANSLFCFWCFYLREHYDQEMYNDFLRIAREDVAGGSHYGIECFFRFCSYGLEIKWNPDVFEDFQNESLEDYNRDSTYGLEKLKAFLVNQKHEFTIPVKPRIREILARFKDFKSFRQKNPNAPNRNRVPSKPASQQAPKIQIGQKVQPQIKPVSNPTPNQNIPQASKKIDQPQVEKNPNRQNQNRRHSNTSWKFGNPQPSSAPKLRMKW